MRESSMRDEIFLLLTFLIWGIPISSQVYDILLLMVMIFAFLFLQRL